MRVVITGGAGFIGSHLADEWILRGAKVHIIDDLSTGRMAHIHQDAVFHLADISQPEVRARIAEIKPQVVYHLAAQVDVQRSLQSPSEDARINVEGTIQVLEACRVLEDVKVIFASTCAVYGDLNQAKIRETDAVKPISCYGLSKLTAEQYIRLFHERYGLRYTILRYANVYGPRQTTKGEGGVAAIFASRLMGNEPLVVHGDGEQTRDFIYVQDVVQANVAAVKYGDQRILQVGTAQPTTVNKLAIAMKKAWSSQAPIKHGPARPGDIRHSCLDNQEAIQTLHWRPRYELSQGLKAMAEAMGRSSGIATQGG